MSTEAKSENNKEDMQFQRHMKTSSSNPNENSSTHSSSLSSSSSASSVYSSSNSNSLASSSHSSEDENTSSSASVAASPSPRVPKPDSGIRHLKLNPNLQFNEPDDKRIKLPSGGEEQELRNIVLNYSAYAEGRYRIVDYFRTALEMFLGEVSQEYRQQFKTAKDKGRDMKRFTWSNKGELAICFATCCDMLKLLYNQLEQCPQRPSWDSFVDQFILLVILETRIPPTVLSQNTYRTKYLDWRKGGTRYQGVQFASNVRFPSAEERRLKVETYLRSGGGYSIESTIVETPTTVRNSVLETTPSVVVVVATTGHGTTSKAAVPPVAVPRIQGPVKIPAKIQIKAPSTLLPGRQAISEKRHNEWCRKLTQYTTNSPTLMFPDYNAHKILAFVLFCDNSETPLQFDILVKLLANSSEIIQSLFERNGGMRTIRIFVTTLYRLRDAVSLKNLVENLLLMKIPAWGTSSQQVWLRDDTDKCCKDLRWMRALDFIPTENRASWTTLVSKLEQRYVLSTPREERERLKAKRPRSGTDETLFASLTDNGGVMKSIPCISTALCVTLPDEFQNPSFSTGTEEEIVEFFDRKMQYCRERQTSWEETLRQALGVNSEKIQIPLWYDPYQLLSARPSSADS